MAGRAVVAAVLTYNRRDLLEACLRAIAAQTTPPDAIVVLDNASSDGTDSLLGSVGGRLGIAVVHIRLEANIGPAAGFNLLFRRCYDAGADWLWVMDDDVVPAPDALEQLGRAFGDHFNSPREVGFLISSVISPDGSPNNVPSVDDRRGPRRCPAWARFLKHGLVQVRCASLVSILIPRTTLEDFGAPSSAFYAWGEDSDYTMRVTAERPGFIVGASEVLHMRGVPGDLDIFTEGNPARLGWFYYLYRNTLCLRRRYWPVHSFALFLMKALGHAARCLVLSPRSPRRAGIILSGVVAGLFFNPAAEAIGSRSSATSELDIRSDSR